MIINKNSWHHKFLLSVHRRPPESLFKNSCEYVRAVLVAIAGICMLSFLSLTLIGLLLYPIAVLIISILGIVEFGEFSVIGITEIAICIIGALGYMWSSLRVVTEKEPSILKQRYRNHKDKVCTKIEYIKEK